MILTFRVIYMFLAIYVNLDRSNDDGYDDHLDRACFALVYDPSNG